MCHIIRMRLLDPCESEIDRTEPEAAGQQAAAAEVAGVSSAQPENRKTLLRTDGYGGSY
ncbi:MAG: hypothetical protein KY464_01025 [Gemmatimonadetes bacterium]|nr:hypothetical protein [Gemmatimonadota bacterium]